MVRRNNKAVPDPCTCQFHIAQDKLLPLLGDLGRKRMISSDWPVQVCSGTEAGGLILVRMTSDQFGSLLITDITERYR